MLVRGGQLVESLHTEKETLEKDSKIELLDSAEGGTSMLHNLTKPRPWRGGSQVIEDVSELKRVEVKGQDWNEKRQVGTSEQMPEDTPWENSVSQDLEEALSPQKWRN